MFDLPLAHPRAHMKSILFFAAQLIALIASTQSTPQDSIRVLEPVEVKATRASERAPFTKTNINRSEIERNNLGYDLPFMLSQQPAVVAYSDAGNGIGYTGLRIRGSDASRINVTVNGIPFNDQESQGAFFVDMPDILSSVGSIQIQRGVGTSSNGAAAFGATINISTNEMIRERAFHFNNSFGSFNSWKNTASVSSGLIGERFTTDFRVSRISSDGFIDRASSKLHSFYFSTAYFGKSNSLRLTHFSGKEKTYQAWYGIAETDLHSNRTINYAGTERPGAPYEDETDNYKQDHFQLFFTQKLTTHLKLNTGLFYVRGLGYYEQYKADQFYSDYDLMPPVNGNDTMTTTDLVRQLWLDNHFYGNVFSLHYEQPANQFTFGGSWMQYDGAHYGDVTWASNGLSLPARWYDHDALKTDLNFYFKHSIALSGKISFFYDLQYRALNYKIEGFRNNPSVVLNNNFRFFNPKFGFNLLLNEHRVYASYARGSKEPNRDDFETGIDQTPKPEYLNDLEVGYERKTQNLEIGAVVYHMRYKDQLILTGQINDVGAYTRTNVPKSYRVGAEVYGALKINRWLKADANISLSRNKISSFTEYIDDYDNGGQIAIDHVNSDIGFSPRIIGGFSLHFINVKRFDLVFNGRYTSSQYLDNTSNNARKLDAFYIQDIHLSYVIPRFIKKGQLFARVNNVFNVMYEPNGYTYSYRSGGMIKNANYYFPMAGINYMAGLNITF